MQFQFYASNFKITDEQKIYAEEKVRHVTKNAPRVEDESTVVKVDFRKTKLASDDQRFACEVTLFVPGAVVRAECKAPTAEAAIDMAEEKLRRQIERYKGKMHRRGHKGEWIPTSTLEAIEAEQSEVEHPKIIKRKRYESTRGPITEEEAIEQMELLGHDFFLFENADTKRFSVIYRRYHEGYGVIEPLGEGEKKEDYDS